MSDLVERMREHLKGDHARGCDGRTHTCKCGFDADSDCLIAEAAEEIGRLKKILAGWGEYGID